MAQATVLPTVIPNSKAHNRLVLRLALHAIKFLQFPPGKGDKPHYFGPLALRWRPEVGVYRLVSSVLIFKSPLERSHPADSSPPGWLVTVLVLCLLLG